MRDREGEATQRKGRQSKVIRATAFQAVTFFDPESKRQVIVLYALDENGIVREFGNNVWKPYPILE